MKKSLLKILALGLILSLLTLTALACQGSEEPEGTEPPKASESEPTQDSEEKLKVAMVLTSAINDAGWGESAYKGLMAAEEKYGVTTAYSEQVQQADFETVMRDYATQNFDLVLLVGNEFSDVALKVAPEFEDVKFAVMNGNESQEPNVAAYRFNTPETGFTAGYLAALYTESNVVGTIVGSSYPHMLDAMDAFVAGAEYCNPDIEVLTGNSESMTDIARGKEMGLAMVEQGADVLNANANAVGLGVIDAAESKGIRYIGYISDQYDTAPETIMVSVVQSNEFLISSMVNDVLEDKFDPILHLLGMSEGAIYISDFHGHDDKLPEGGMDKVNELVAGIKDGSLKEAGILPPSAFEKQE